ncbi:MAG: SpoIIE family protein phosphatase [Oligoflexus sp.]
MEILRDPSKLLSIQDMLTNSHNEDWQFRNNTIIGFTEDVLWVRFTIVNEENVAKTLIFEDQWSLTERIDVYQVSAGQLINSWADGSKFGIEHRHRPHRFPMFEIRIEPGVHSFYLRYQSNDIIGSRLIIWDADNFIDYVDRENILLGVLLGWCLIMPLYNLCIYFALRVPVFLYYAAYVLSFFTLQMALQGVFYRYINDHTWFTSQATLVFAMLATALVAMFTNIFLELKEHLPRWSKIGQVITLIAFLNIPLAHTHFQLAAMITILINIPLMTWMMLSAIYLAYKRYTPAYIYLIAWGFFVVGDLFSILYYIGLHQMHSMGRWGLIVGASFEVVLISFGLANNFHRIRKEMLTAKVNESQMKASIETARTIQDALIERGSGVPCIKVASHYLSTETTCGDWFSIDYDPRQKRVYMLIGDVTGHGLSSALVTSAVSGAIETTMQMSAEICCDPQSTLIKMAESANRVVLKTGFKSGHMMTMNLLCLDLNNGDVHFLNAGHNNSFWVQSSGSVQSLFVRGSILGVHKNPRWNLRSIRILPGDQLIMYTDGLLENTSENGETLSIRTLKRIITSKHQHEPQQVIDQIISDASRIWGSHQVNDDVTLLVLEWLGANDCECEEDLPA